MKISEQQIEEIVRGVMQSVASNGSAGNGSVGNFASTGKGNWKIDDPQNHPTDEHLHSANELRGLHGIFDTVEDAVEAARVAQRTWIKMPIAQRKICVDAMRAAGRANARKLAEMTVEETGLGRVEDKVIKNQLCSDLTPGWEVLPTQMFQGDLGLTIDDHFPYGVICGITPVTNPTSGLINNAIIFAIAGNAAVFCPHPSAKKCTMTTMALLNDAVANAGGPRNLFTGVANPTLETVDAVMRHPAVRLINATGGPGVVKAALAVGKKAVCAGPGNPPAIVDETADLENAARSIVNGASFDNNLLCIGEKAIVVVDSVADALLGALQRAGAYFARGEEARKLADYVVQGDHINREPIGWDAARILRKCGINAPESSKIGVLELPADHVLVLQEQLLPIVPLVRARDFQEALGIALRIEGGRGHTLAIHSLDVSRITAVRNAYQCTVFVANGSTAAAEGVGGEGFVAMSLAGHTGEGFTTAATFVKRRRAAFVGALGSGAPL
jgi:propionaldehyde dehydrogenase